MSLPLRLIIPAFSVLTLAVILCLSTTVQCVTTGLDCVLTVPSSPFTATALSTPWIVSGCKQAATPTFVQATIIDLDTGTLTTYSPLVVESIQQVAFAPTVPVLPIHYIAAVWIGSNGRSLTLQGTITNGLNSLIQADCVNGGGSTTFSIFGTIAACNARAFYDAANKAINMGLLKVPPLGNDVNGNPCPSSRDFGLVDSTPSSSVTTVYLLGADGTFAQSNTDNSALYAQNQITTSSIVNTGGEALLTFFLSPALGCKVWKIPDLADKHGIQQSSSFATNQLQARFTVPPAAFLTVSDPMTMTNSSTTGTLIPDLGKMNALRAIINQTPIYQLTQAKLPSYCSNLYRIGAVRITQWLPKLLNTPSPTGTSLASLIVQRYNLAVGSTTATSLGCDALLGIASPLSGLIDANGNIQTNVLNTLNIKDSNALAVDLGVSNINIFLDTQFGEASTDATKITATAAPTTAPPVIVGTGTTGTKLNSTISLAIGIGAAVGIGIVGGIIAFYCLKRYRNRKLQQRQYYY